MPIINVNTDDIRETATILRTKMTEMESALTTANSQVESLRVMQGGPRFNQDLAQWDELKVKIDQIIQVIPEAATLLDKAANDFEGPAGY